MFEKILIAGRGEIALRVQRTCREMGIQTVMVYSEADVSAKYVRLADEAVCIGPPPAGGSYMNAAAIISAAEITGAQAIHPGYGFLSENADFAEQVERSGFVFIGPNPETIRLMGDKIEAKKYVKKSGLEMIPSCEGSLPKDPQEAAKEVEKLGFPLVIKAAAGGGGRGMRVVLSKASLLNIISVLRREALAAFGDDTLYAERYLDNPRHVEVQVIADGKNAVHLGTRDCSLQRRFQKIMEEAPAPNIPSNREAAICNLCVKVCKKLGYKNAGTFEFLYDGKIFYFIEMNTRLQVEHPVSEMITGIDIVAQQIKIAAGESMLLRQKDIHFSGSSIECRVNAEEPENFLPSPGTISQYHPPGGNGVRVDSHAYSGYQIPPYYDSLIAKLIVHGADRRQALARMRSALREYIIDGISTNLPLHGRLLRDAGFVKGGVGIRHLENQIKDGLMRKDSV